MRYCENVRQHPQPLTVEQTGRVQAAVAAVLAGTGWGAVTVVIIKGRVVGIKTEISETID